MTDQVAALQQSVAGRSGDSTPTLSLSCCSDLWRRIEGGGLDLLYLSPEG